MSTNRPPRYNHGTSVDTRLSRLETIIDNISASLEKIQNKLDQESKINWTPIGIGITIFMAVVGSFGTIYSTRMSQTDDNIKGLTEITQNLVVSSTEQKTAIHTLKDRQDDVEDALKKNSDRIRDLEAKTQKLKTDLN